MSTQVFLASTPYGAAVFAAALDAGCLAPADRRILLVATVGEVPEAAPGVHELPGFAGVRERFDEVRSWNEAVRPLHPDSWAPRAADVPLWERCLRADWALGDGDVALVVESVTARPALSVAQVFTDAPVTVCAADARVYGPTPARLDPLLGTRVERLLHLDLAPGLAPLLLTEFGVPAATVPGAAFAAVVAEIADTAGRAAPAGAGETARAAARGSGPMTAGKADPAAARDTAPTAPAKTYRPPTRDTTPTAPGEADRPTTQGTGPMTAGKADPAAARDTAPTAPAKTYR
ncbi:hypothetical protein GTY84_17960, partial [Streptomyces sp. SID8352]|nr:hypothetical protein [Streptomyces sp. SID8352]